MSKKTSHSRLETLFKDIDSLGTEQTTKETGSLAGWYWECSPDGIYASCSPEVEDCLGYRPEEFAGRSIFQFHLHPDSTATLRLAFQAGDWPKEVEAFFLSASGELLPARINLMTKLGKNGHEPRCQGFVQILPKDALPAPSSIAPSRLQEREPAKRKDGTGSLGVTGIALESGGIQPASSLWTRAAIQSLAANQTVAAHGEDDSPSSIAVPINLRDRGMGIVEIVDDADHRKWTEDERLLVQEVANQLGLALENADLYQAVQAELGERVRAEQEIRTRNQDLATLNLAGQQLSKLTSPEEIFALLQQIALQVFGDCGLAIAHFDASRRTVSFPVYQVKDKSRPPDGQPLGNDVVGYLFWTKKPLLIERHAEAEMVDKGISLPGRTPLSLLGIPMVAGDRPVGAIVLQDFEREAAFSSIHVELLSTLASQATTALENANLFQEIRSALSAIENRERYQANVALVAATLSKYGSKSLPEVLASLGEAAQASRVYFAQACEDAREPYFQATNEWVSPSCKSSFDHTRVEYIPAFKLAYLQEQLRENGWFAKTVGEMPFPDREFFESRGVRSALVLSVPGRTRLPGFIAFEQTDADRAWQLEEVRILQVATDALSNTILRENLLKQVQVSLRETETLYNVSHNLSLASDPQEMLATFASGLQVPEINRCVLVAFDYNNQGNLVRMPVAANWHNGEGVPPPAIGSVYNATVYSGVFFRPSPVFFEDANEAKIEPQAKMDWVRENIHSIALLPMWAGKRQIGVLLLESEQKKAFTEQVRRAAPPLVDQLATSIENMRLFNETERALAETGLLYQVSNAISQAANLQDLVMVIAKNLLPARVDKVSLSLIDVNTESEPVEIELAGHYEVNKDFHRTSLRYPASFLPFFASLSKEPAIITDVRPAEIDTNSKKFLLDSGMVGVCILPLWTSGRLVGSIAVSSREPLDLGTEEVHNLQVAANGIAVAVERQRLLQEAQRRALELQTAAEIARDTTSTLALNQLLSGIVNLLCERFGFYHASVFLLDNTKSFAIVQESTGEAGRDMKERGHKLAVGSRSIIGKVTGSGEPMIINDTGRSSIYFPNALLPETRAEMAIPLKLGAQVIGALDIQSQRVNAFSKNDLAVLQVLADQIAIAIENARAYEMSQKVVEEMREIDRMKSQFLANMSHELRTPLNSIIGFSRVILKGIDGPINETQGQDLNAIYNSGQHLLYLINDILDLSKIEAGKMELSFSEFALGELVNSVMSTGTGLVKGKPVKLVQVIPPDLPMVRADNTRVRQVLLNFVSNAAKFTDEGNITIEAQLVKSPKGDKEVMMTVTDSGAGIAAEDTHKLFQPFSQVDDSPTRKTGGTGLGLSICRSLIEMHGGRIGLLRSEVGTGSTFFFTLPLSKPEPEPEPDADINGLKTILCIDDDAQVVSLYERYLKPHGYRVVALTDPHQAVQRAAELKPSAITLDIMMPERDGWQVMHDLKNDAETRGIPILVCSILEEEEKGFNLGAADYLVKPFAQDDLLSAINRLNPNGQIHDVLVIDDSPDDLRLVQKMIADSGLFRVTAAEGGEAGWQSIQTSRPDVIIMDLFMPGMNGFDLLEQLRAEPMLSTIPVIVLTGADLTPEQKQQLAEFGKQLMAKGCLNEKELLKSLEASLKQLHLIEDNPPK